MRNRRRSSASSEGKNAVSLQDASPVLSKKAHPPPEPKPARRKQQRSAAWEAAVQPGADRKAVLQTKVVPPPMKQPQRVQAPRLKKRRAIAVWKERTSDCASMIWTARAVKTRSSEAASSE